MTTLPTFSIIVPTFNRPLQLWHCLQAMTQLDYPPDRFEVIVVDDGGKLPLEPIVAEFEARMGVVLVTQPNSGPAAARNTGARVANGRFIAFTDDDCAPHPAWLRHLALFLAEHPEEMVGGYTKNGLPHNWFSQTSQLLIDFLYVYYNRTESRARFFTSNNFALAASLYWQVGGFDESLPLAAGEDREFCDRWQQYGLSMVYLPQAVVEHEHHLQMATFWRQHFNYGRGAWLFHQVRSQRTQETVQLESPDFYLKLMGYPLIAASGARAFGLTIMLMGTQVANAAGFFFQRFTGPPRDKKKLPLRELYVPVENGSNAN